MFFPRADWREGLQNFATPVRRPGAVPELGFCNIQMRIDLI